MPKLAVLGHPVSHSRSPAMQNAALGGLELWDWSYEAIDVAPAEFEARVREMAAGDFAGANVTVPHKEAAFRLVDRRDPAAERTGAVNTVLVGEDGRLLGRNTDGRGFLAGLQAEAPPGWDPAAGPAVVLGAGGAARGVAVALLDAGVRALRLANRTSGRAGELAAVLRQAFPAARVEAVAWEERAAALEGVALLANATSLGMAGQPPLELPLDALPPAAVVADLVYVPLETGLLARARARGNPAVDGLGMLLHQAVPGFERWFGVRPEVTAQLKAHVAASLGGA